MDTKVFFIPTAITDAAEANDLEKLKTKINQLHSHIIANDGDINGLTVEINYWDSYALRHAAEHGYLEIVRLLLDYNANPTAMNSEAVQLAAQNGHKDIVQLLVEKGARYQNHQDYELMLSKLNRFLLLYLIKGGWGQKSISTIP